MRNRTNGSSFGFSLSCRLFGCLAGGPRGVVAATVLVLAVFGFVDGDAFLDDDEDNDDRRFDVAPPRRRDHVDGGDAVAVVRDSIAGGAWSEKNCRCDFLGHW